MKELQRTYQSIVFPLDRQLAKDLGDMEFKKQLQQQFFHIEDDLLYDLITYGDGSRQEQRWLKGFTYEKGIATGILTFLVSRALDIYRLPYAPDRLFCAIMSRENEHVLKRIYTVLTPGRIDAIVSEIRAIYAHTQKMLASASLSEVVLTRRVRDEGSWARGEPNYATKIAKEKLIAEHRNISSVRFEMDTLNSFGEGSYASYPVMLEFRVPATDVLYCSNLIASRGGSYDKSWVLHKPAVERGEWITVNRALDGVVELPISQIHLNRDGYRVNEGVNWDAKQPSSDPIVFRTLEHLVDDDWPFNPGLAPRPLQRLHGALQGLIRGSIQGFRQGWFF